MKPFAISLWILILFAFPTSGSNVIRLKITDETSAPLSDCNVFMKNKCYFLTDDTGCIDIPLTYCHSGDTIQVSYMGFETLHIVLSPVHLQNQQIQVFRLKPQTYALDDVTVTAHAEKFFEKKKKNMLLPYSDKHPVRVLASVNMDVNGEQTQASGHLNILFRLSDQEVTENTCTTDTLLLRQIKRNLVLASYIPYEFCYQKYRKLTDVYYLGIQKDRYVFRFDVKPEAVTHPFFGFQPGDEVSSIVYVEKNGFISRIETRTNVKSGKSKSYNLSVDYIEYKNKMAPAYIDIACIQEKIYLELICTY